MLKRKCYDIFESFKRYSEGLSRVVFADDDFNTTEIISRAPVALVEELSLEIGEIKRLNFPGIRQIYIIVREEATSAGN